MKIIQRLSRSPNGAQALPDQVVALRKMADGTTIDGLNSDTAGMIKLPRYGQLEPYYLHLPDVPGGDKFWVSNEVKTAGALSLLEVPLALRGGGDGVLHLRPEPNESALNALLRSNLEVTQVSGGPNVTVSPGVAVVGRHVLVNYGTLPLTCQRPPSGTRADRIVFRVYPARSTTGPPGKAEIVCIEAPTTDGVPPPLVQNSEEQIQFPLYRQLVPYAGQPQLIDERQYFRERISLRGSVRQPAFLTSNTASTGDVVTQPLVLTLPRNVPYDVTAQVTGYHNASEPTWVKVLDLNPSTGWGFGTSLQLMAPDLFGGAVYV